MAPYELIYGMQPRTSFDWNTKETTTANEQLSKDQARKVAGRMEDAWKVARTAMEQAQNKKRKDVDPYRREVNFQVGDKVWLSTKNLRSERPSRKLGSKFEGPFEITKQEGFAFRIRVPSTWKINPVFAPELLRKDPDDPLPFQDNPEPEPVDFTDHQEWEVEKILAVRKVGRQLKYRVKWVGFDDDLDWYPSENFENSPYKLREFHRQYPDQPGPPRKLANWIQTCEERERVRTHFA